MSRLGGSDIEAALARSDQVWTNFSTHIECEAAFIDRLWLADEIRRQRRQITELIADNVEWERELHAAAAEIEHLENALIECEK